ncbi:MAG: energy transducer TonB [Muribaculaceae bacterium]|nr:energy transducer TonB [Muribaculaceae bacterium]
MIPVKPRPVTGQPAPPQQPPRMHGPDESSVRPSGGNRWWIYVAVAVGVAAIAGALVFFLKKDDGYSSEDAEAEAEAVEYTDEVVEDVPAAAEWTEEYAEIEQVPFEEILIVEDEVPVAEAVAEEAVAEEAVVSAVDLDLGTDDLHVVRTHRDEVVHEEAPEYDEDKTFTTVEQMPQFPGGEAALMSWVANHIKYPAIAQENGVQGKVVVRFVVKKDGSIGVVTVVRGKDPDLDKEAVRVVKTLPNFTPGKMNGQPVNVWYTLPITFKLQGV